MYLEGFEFQGGVLSQSSRSTLCSTCQRLGDSAWERTLRPASGVDHRLTYMYNPKSRLFRQTHLTLTASRLYLQLKSRRPGPPLKRKTRMSDPPETEPSTRRPRERDVREARRRRDGRENGGCAVRTPDPKLNF
ncbi:hypothetical protein DY000_02035408 [Brassica cretica]|uniref:Uncharacterized protein n=1 Tax=Brassica cretica TaxID=69181 RepID=A0ABQ7DNH7_BRACR|nr:hypothetical protein DY000_02035408 [Brassica cretica]